MIQLINVQDKLRPQLRQILTHCKMVGYITPRSAIDDYGIMSLARRINDLEALGYEVQRQNRKHPATGQRYTRYFVSPEPKALSAAS
ncbi:helix-turn-helix domain-containing protein [Devosia enhydra]|uniref:helix-turn-helix domain-containing protein n=1 Tax=Devosia enhydra TaxID=665118 RepID=UPI0015A67922|nr:helix-turn-helix domain-containing protein [Devosia enhydra]